MNRFHLLAAAALIAAVLPARVSAQAYATDRGSFIVGGSAGTSTNTFTIDLEGEPESERVSLVHLAPQALYFVTPGLALGGRVSASLISDDEDTSTQLGVGPQVAYYFGRGERPYYPYLSAGVSYEDVANDEAGVGANAQAGLVFLLARGVGLDTSLFYRRQEAEPVRHESLGLAVGITAFVF
jgi:hypothetical protein